MRLAVLRLAVLRLVLRFAVLRLAVLRFAVLRFAVLRFAVLRLAVLRLAVLRLAVDLRLRRLVVFLAALGAAFLFLEVFFEEAFRLLLAGMLLCSLLEFLNFFDF